MSNLLLCALHRLGKPGTAADVLDSAVGLAMDASWPRRSWTSLTTQKVFADLRGMRARGELAEAGTRNERGRDVPLFAPAGAGGVVGEFFSDFPMPDMPAPDGEDHPLRGLTKRQQYALFDAQDRAIEVMARQSRETHDLFQRHARELGEHAIRAKRELVTVGIEREEVE